MGGGATPLTLTLAAFVAGSVLATFHMPFWLATPSLGEITLGDAFGWRAAIGLQLITFGLIAGVTWWIEPHRRRARSVIAPSGRGWTRLVHGPWPLWVGGVALAALNALTLLLAGHPWAITWGFTLWGGKLLLAVGYDLSTVPFWQGPFQQAALAVPVLADVTSVMDLGLVLGALLGAGLAGRFVPPRRIALRFVAPAVVGGLLLGYGARIAFGCNIGAYFSGIASTSLHGWVWGLGALLGTPLGITLRRPFGIDGRQVSTHAG